MAQVTVKVTVDSKLPSPADGKKLASQYLANTLLAKSRKSYVPWLTGNLANAGKVEPASDGKYAIVYDVPYARYLWYGKKMVNAKTGRGPHWFDGYGFRYRKGTKLKATETSLVYNRAWDKDDETGEIVTYMHEGNADASDHWLERTFEDHKDELLQGVADILTGKRKE